MTWWQNFKARYGKIILWPFMGLGISVQAPINLVGGLLTLWARESGLELKDVGLFAAVTLPYSLKFLWAPLVDRLTLPFFKKMGRKKAWCFTFQLGVLGGLLVLSMLDPLQDTIGVFCVSFWIAFCAASQELTVDALRIDTLKDDDLTHGTVLYQFGTRLGYFAATAGMIALSAYLPWRYVYRISVSTVVVGIVSLFLLKKTREESMPASFYTMVVAPFKEFMSRQNLGILCLFIVLYKLCNGMLGKMAYPFYYDVGFTKNQIALVSATFGSIITTLGIFCGGWILDRFRFKKLLFWLGAIEILTSLAFAGLAWVGPSIKLFFLVIIFDNIIGGMGGAVWTVFLSRQCCRAFSATQYAFLNALTMVPLTLLATSGGWLAQHMGWPEYFIFTGILMVPALVMIATGMMTFAKTNQK